jgi:hypothetical protein
MYCEISTKDDFWSVLSKENKRENIITQVVNITITIFQLLLYVFVAVHQVSCFVISNFLSTRRANCIKL